MKHRLVLRLQTYGIRCDRVWPQLHMPLWKGVPAFFGCVEPGCVSAHLGLQELAYGLNEPILFFYLGPMSASSENM